MLNKTLERIAVALIITSIVSAAGAVVSVKIQENDIQWIKKSVCRIEDKLDKVLGHK